VFRLPKDDSTDYIKRVIGLPGDRIQMKDGVLYINGTAVKKERVEDFIDDENNERVLRFRETLPNGVVYEVLDLQDNGFLDNTQEYVVLPDHYFMMCDNRDNSTDSRVLSAVGYVPLENIIGRATILFFSIGNPPSLRSDSSDWPRPCDNMCVKTLWLLRQRGRRSDRTAAVLLCNARVWF
jgi:signal peptidase I